MYNSMVACKTTVRKWGNSLGIRLPKDLVSAEHIKVDEELIVIVRKSDSVLSETFGMLKRKKGQTGQKVKDMLKRELHGIE